MAGHPESGVNFIERAEGCKDAVKAVMPEVIITEISTDGDPEVTRQRTADYLTANLGVEKKREKCFHCIKRIQKIRKMKYFPNL